LGIIGQKDTMLLSSQNTDGQPPVTALVEVLIDTMGLLGDNADNFTTIIMHSKVFNDFLKAGLVQFGQTNFGNSILESGDMPTILGRRVIVSDNVPVENYTVGTSNFTRYTTYIAQNGAIKRYIQTKQLELLLSSLTKE